MHKNECFLPESCEIFLLFLKKKFKPFNRFLKIICKLNLSKIYKIAKKQNKNIIEILAKRAPPLLSESSKQNNQHSTQVEDILKEAFLKLPEVFFVKSSQKISFFEHQESESCCLNNDNNNHRSKSLNRSISSKLETQGLILGCLDYLFT